MALRLKTTPYEAPCFRLEGERFGRLTVAKKAGKSVGSGGVRWLCRCDCGGEKVVGSVLLAREN
jgi:hypothetical protein